MNSHSTTYIIIFLTVLLAFVPRSDAGETLAQNSAENLDPFFNRLAEDLQSGEPLVLTTYIALCDNDTQGIVPVKNPKICDGDIPGRNLYWNTSGGLAGWARHHGFKRVLAEEEFSDTILVRAVWRKRMRAAGKLKARGVDSLFDIYIVGLAYRGSRIEQAMIDYLHAVNHDDEETVELKNNRIIRYGGAGHIVGYVGHDYFLDVTGDRRDRLMAELGGKSSLAKGTFALACLGDDFIRPAITRENVYIFILNKQLAFPGAWTIGGIVQGVARGERGKGIRRTAARAFADGMGKSYGAILRSFAYGP